MSATAAGTVVAMPLSGALCVLHLGWPSVFYVFGALGIIWSISFFYFGADCPSEHPTICPYESQYINNSLGRFDNRSIFVLPIFLCIRLPFLLDKVARTR